jgi:hypothetical protein
MENVSILFRSGRTPIVAAAGTSPAFVKAAKAHPVGRLSPRERRLSREDATAGGINPPLQTKGGAPEKANNRSLGRHHPCARKDDACRGPRRGGDLVMTPYQR